MRNKEQQVYLGLVCSMRKNRLRDPAMNRVVEEDLLTPNNECKQVQQWESNLTLWRENAIKVPPIRLQGPTRENTTVGVGEREFISNKAATPLEATKLPEPMIHLLYTFYLPTDLLCVQII
jgi:hypothetical protein